MNAKPTVNIWLDTRRTKKGKKYPVKIRITSQRQRYYYPTNINLTAKEFENATSAKPSPKLKQAHLQLYELERQATATINKIVDELHAQFDIALFEKFLSINSQDYAEVFHCFQRKIDELKELEQIKTAVVYETSRNAFKKYINRDQLLFAEIDKKFLESFEAHLLKNNKSLTTVSIYTRNLRTIYNEAIDTRLVSRELYPFGRNKYQVPQPSNTKRALAEEDLLKIFNYKPQENTWDEYARDMWTLSLLTQGMNMKDIANLRYKNIMDDKLIFTRQKTKRTKKATQTPVVVYLDEAANTIIRKYGSDNTSPNQFVFPIYNDDNTPLQNLRGVEQQIKMINKYMRKIAAQLGIKHDCTFQSARHSFATTLKRQGRSTEEIGEFLGHADKRTTQNYLASFGDEHKRSIMNDFVRKLKNG